MKVLLLIFYLLFFAQLIYIVYELFDLADNWGGLPVGGCFSCFVFFFFFLEAW
jgi:hypothetical protein